MVGTGNATVAIHIKGRALGVFEDGTNRLDPSKGSGSLGFKPQWSPPTVQQLIKYAEDDYEVGLAISRGDDFIKPQLWVDECCRWLDDQCKSNLLFTSRPTSIRADANLIIDSVEMLHRSFPALPLFPGTETEVEIDLRGHAMWWIRATAKHLRIREIPLGPKRGRASLVLDVEHTLRQ